MADGVEVREGISSKGRALFATRNFQKDDILFEECPLVSSQFLWNSLYGYAACDLCMRPLETAQESAQRLSSNASLVLPHPECCSVDKSQHVSCSNCQVMFCCERCRDVAWERYHRILCLGHVSPDDVAHPLIRLQEAWRTMHYPPETASIMLIARMIATVKQAANKEAMIRMFNTFCHNTVNEEEEIAHKLLGTQFQQQQDVLRELMREALYEEDLQQWFTLEGFRSLFALIGTNGQGIGTSSISEWVSKVEDLEAPEDEKDKLDSFIDKLYEDMDKVSGQFLNSEGSGLYQLQSTCNHSCSPNAQVTFPHNNYTLVVRALEDIESGQEICISYLECCDLERSRHSRQKELRENYLFNCDCPKCLSQADDPDVTSEEDMDEEDEEEEDEEN